MAPTPFPNTGLSQYIYTTSAPNNVVNGGELFVCNASQYNGLPSDVIPFPTLVLGGTAFFVPNGGTFRIDYEISLNNATVLALFVGANTTTLVANSDTYIGTSSTTNWFHGTWILAINAGSYVGLGSLSTTQIALTGGISTQYMIRLTFNKVV
jgi:hypothetical protein